MSNWGPPPSGPPPLGPPRPRPAPPPRRRRRRRRASKAQRVAGVLAAVVFVAGVIAALASGESEPFTFGVAVGDCYDTSEETTDLDVTDCDGTHDREAFVVEDFEDDGGDFPGTEELVSQSSRVCLEEFEGYVDQEFLESRFNFEVVIPTEARWEDGARQFVCALFPVSGESSEGAARGSGE